MSPGGKAGRPGAAVAAAAANSDEGRNSQMKVIVIATRADRPAEEFAPILGPESKKALSLMAEDFVREIYSRNDGKGAVLVCEAANEEEAKKRLSELPLVQAGLLDLEFYPVGPYRGIVAAAKG
jgi:hypothetical protein